MPLAKSESFLLRFRQTLIGHISNANCSDDTWHGSFKPVKEVNCDPVSSRVASFIKFCGEWNDRFEINTQNPPDANEFDQFSDVVSPGSWSVESDCGRVMGIFDAPFFFSDGSITWRLM
jgi:hypothetical protein